MRQYLNIINEAYALDEDFRAKRADRNQLPLTPNKSVLKNEAFRQWFGKSKVVDHEGSPLVCFHGTFEEFTEFKYKSERRGSYGLNRIGFWFDTHPATPNYFAGYADDATTTGSIMPVYLKIENPFILDSEFLFSEDRDEYVTARNAYFNLLAKRTRSHDDDLEIAIMKAQRAFDEAKEKLKRERYDGFDRMMQLLPNGVKSTTGQVAAFQGELISEGFDGIHLIDTFADGGTRDHMTTDWWIAFRPNQIKSAYTKSFTDSPNITEDDA